VTFIAQSLWGCGDTLVFDITVSGLPTAAFVAAPAVQTFPNATVELANLSSANDQAGYMWFWGDGNSTFSGEADDPASYTYETWGEYDIVLRVGTDLCNDTTTQRIRINPPLPIASFDGSGKGCVPLVVEFTNTSTYGVSYLWDFGDGTVSNEENPSHVYYQPGTYNVTLTATGPGGDTNVEIKTGVAIVHPRAEAFFTVNPPVITVPEQVFFLNLSTDATIFTWDFGDGSTSTEFSPYHFYETTGWHEVTLVANNEFDCPDTFVLENAVLGNIESDIGFPNAFTPSENGPGGGYWTIDDMFNNNIFFPIYKGVDEFEMQIFNRWGELLFETKDVRQGWDGYYRGQLCQQDVYVWRVKVTFLDGGEMTDIGDVTLLR
jgi:gliding motility-associated-like protein